MGAAIRIRRVYEPAKRSDGLRILVDRLWPRGLSKADAAIDYWSRDAAPSNELRRWYRHEPSRWPEFKRRYFAELDANPEAVEQLLDALGRRRATFLFSSKEERLNNAAALEEYVSARR
ncbi:MAG: DUF488 family protein [Myxococcota bacterium]|nr:DUF488 family protein [Myxococcota bacterium]